MPEEEDRELQQARMKSEQEAQGRNGEIVVGVIDVGHGSTQGLTGPTQKWNHQQERDPTAGPGRQREGGGHSRRSFVQGASRRAARRRRA